MEIPQETLQLIKGFIDPLVKKPMTSLGDMFNDSIKYKQLQNQIRMFGKVKELTKKNGLTIKNVRTNVMFDLLQGIGEVDEEDELLQDMWSNLFVNYIDSKSNLKLSVYPSILRQLSTKEVEILKEGREISGQIDHVGRNKLSSIRFQDEINLEEVNNLERLGLINLGAGYVTADNSISRNDAPKKIETYYISGFGIDLISWV